MIENTNECGITNEVISTGKKDLGIIVVLELRVAVKDQLAEFRIVPHNTRDHRLVLKTCKCEEHQSAVRNFCELVGIKVLSAWDGANFRILEVDRDEFLSVLSKILSSRVTLLDTPTELVADTEAESP